jgi:hypothetical protein
MVRLLMDQLASQTNASGFERALEELPKTLDDMYDQTIARSIDNAMTRRILSIVMLAARPLLLEELRYMVAWSYADTSTPLDIKLVDDETAFMTRYVGLLTFRDLSGYRRYGSNEGEQIHYGAFFIRKLVSSIHPDLSFTVNISQTTQ